MRTILLAIGFCLMFLMLKAQTNYDVSLVPKALLPYASSVVRTSEATVTVNDMDNITLHLKQAITFLNKNGDSDISIWHNRDNKIKYIKGAVYDASGKLVRKITAKDFEDSYAGQDFSLFEDSRTMRYTSAYSDYPYTIECEYETNSSQSLVFDDWTPNHGFGTAVEKSTYSFVCKPGFKINYKEINTPKKAVITTNAHGMQTYTWEAENLKAIRYEPFSPDKDKYTTIVKIAPVQFTYQHINGTFNNWQQLGQWNYDNLLAGRDKLPDATVETIKRLTADITDDKLKAKKIYEYMQQKTRYISIQVGIGGYRPFLAADVDKTGYGDCKALVNYTGALLKIAGINSYYCVVESGSKKSSLMTDFASMDQGDHVILCLPFKNDTTWLECTSQTMPFGFLSDFTDDRWVLACTPNGGKLLHTPHYTTAMNLTKRKGSFTIDDKGTLTGTMTTTFGGTDFNERDEIISEAYTEQLKSMAEVYPINNLAIAKLEFKQDKTIPTDTETINLSAREYASQNAGKFYFKVNAANRWNHVPDEVRDRTTDVYINRGYTENDEITYTLPTGYHPDRQPYNLTINKPFGQFSAHLTIQGLQVTYKRSLQINEGTYNKDMYQDLVDFYESVSEADNYIMTFVKDN